jgi:hypothetical protein
MMPDHHILSLRAQYQAFSCLKRIKPATPSAICEKIARLSGAPTLARAAALASRVLHCGPPLVIRARSA